MMALDKANIEGVFDDLSIGFDEIKSAIEANPI